MQVNGLTSSQQYPYKNMRQQACRKAGHRNVLPPQFIVKQIEVEFKGDEESLRKLLYRVCCSYSRTCQVILIKYDSRQDHQS
jgi:hypothetical protein